MIKNELILCTGGGGSIGSELVRQLVVENPVYIIDNNETAFFDIYEELKQKGFNIKGKFGCIRDPKVFDDMVRDFGYPSLIFHAAAYKHVTPSAWSPREYVMTNILGTLNVLDFAKKNKIKVINISTDKVVHADSVMGATKKVAEIAVRDAGQISVRFGNVMGSRGSVIPIWQRQADMGEALTVTDERMERYMMSIPQACELLIKAAEIGQPGQILIMDMGERVNIFNLAHEIISKSNKNIEVKLIGVRPGETFVEELMTPEEREKAVKVDNFWII